MPGDPFRRLAIVLLLGAAPALAACAGGERPASSDIDPLSPGLTGPRGSPSGAAFGYTGSSTTPAAPPLPSTTPSGSPNQPSGGQ